jgi:hypothetical protein
MPTLKELLEGDLGASDTVKTASENTVSFDSEIEKLAMEIGLVGDDNSTSSSNANEESHNQGQSKEAKMGLESLYSNMFPEDVVTTTTEKVASQEKVAAEIDEAMGAVAHDSFQKHFDNYITKVASEMLAGGATVSVDKSADAEPVQVMDNNRAGGTAPIDTAPVVTDEITGKQDAKTVGHVEQRSSPMGDMKTAALRKFLLLSQLEK